jgi:cell division protein FtsL
MKRIGFAVSMIVVVAAAAWAYNINYRTKTALGRVDTLRNQINVEREAVEVLRVEWAYLNAPDRLARLVALQNDRLVLVPLGPQHFGAVAEIPFPQRNPEPEYAVPETEIDATLLASRALSTVVTRAPMPTPRPARWRFE